MVQVNVTHSLRGLRQCHHHPCIQISLSLSLSEPPTPHSGKNKLHLQHVNYSDRRSGLGGVTVTQVFDFTASLRWDGHSVTQLPWVVWGGKGRGRGFGGKLNLLLHRDILHHSFCIIWHVPPPVHTATVLKFFTRCWVGGLLSPPSGRERNYTNTVPTGSIRFRPAVAFSWKITMGYNRRALLWEAKVGMLP